MALSHNPFFFISATEEYCTFHCSFIIWLFTFHLLFSKLSYVSLCVYSAFALIMCKWVCSSLLVCVFVCCSYLTVELLSEPDHTSVFVHREIPHGLFSWNSIHEGFTLRICCLQLGHWWTCQTESQRSEVPSGQRSVRLQDLIVF